MAATDKTTSTLMSKLELASETTSAVMSAPESGVSEVAPLSSLVWHIVPTTQMKMAVVHSKPTTTAPATVKTMKRFPFKKFRMVLSMAELVVAGVVCCVVLEDKALVEVVVFALMLT